MHEAKTVDSKALGRLLASKPKLTRQQYKTLKGQILAGDAEGAMRGLEKLTGARTGTQALKDATEKARIPVKLCEHIVEICERVSITDEHSR